MSRTLSRKYTELRRYFRSYGWKYGKRGKRQRLFGGLALGVIALTLIISLIPWGKVGHAMAESAVNKNVEDTLTGQDSRDMRSLQHGRALAAMQYAPARYINRYTASPDDSNVGDHSVSLWGFCPTQTMEHCDDVFSLAQPHAVVSAHFSPDTKTVDSVTLIGVIVPVGDKNLHCIVPDGSEPAVLDTMQPVVNRYGEMAHDGRKHEVFVDDKVWTCRGKSRP